MAERPKKILVLGGVVGGTAAALRLRRLSDDFEITIVDRSEQIGLATCALPYLVRNMVRPEDGLFVHDAKSLWDTYRIKVLSNLEAIRIDRNTKQLVVRDLKRNTKKSLPYDRLILSPGAAPVRPHIEGIDAPLVKTVRTLRDVEDILEVLRHSDSSDAPIVVLGGSYLGLEMVEAFRSRGLPVLLLEAAKQVLVTADIEMVAPLHWELKRQGVDCRFGVSLSKIVQDSGDRVRVVLDGGEDRVARLVVLAVGVRPEVSLALDAGLELGLTGGIRVNDRMQTDDPDIYAIGDAVEIPVRRGGRTLAGRIALAGPARRQAKIAADHLHGFRHHPYESYGGTVSFKFFDLTFASTGSTEKLLHRERIPFEKVYVHPFSRAGRSPEAETLTLKILFSSVDGSLFGAQAVGGDEVVRRIDVLATALRFGATVRQLSDLELCYVPPQGSPRDPIQLAGNIAADLLDGLVRHATCKEMKRPRPNQRFLDVRTAAEFKEDAMPGALSVPLDELRDRLSELDPEKEYLLYSRFGLRGYSACRILLQHGFQAKNFSGGLATYRDLSPTG